MYGGGKRGTGIRGTKFSRVEKAGPPSMERETDKRLVDTPHVPNPEKYPVWNAKRISIDVQYTIETLSNIILYATTM